MDGYKSFLPYEIVGKGLLDIRERHLQGGCLHLVHGLGCETGILELFSTGVYACQRRQRPCG